MISSDILRLVPFMMLIAFTGCGDGPAPVNPDRNANPFAQTVSPSAQTPSRSNKTSRNPTSSREPYLERLKAFKTNLRTKGPSPQEWDSEPLPPNTSEVKYQSGDHSLKAWVYRPPGHSTTNSTAKHPALVYFHGGFAFGASDLEDCRPFMDAGFVVMCPMLRGENGNPGHFEMLMGEVDDAKAAVQWLAAQPDVNPDRIYAFGHSIGGGVTTLLSLRANVPLQASGSSGGLYGPTTFYGWSDMVPFQLADARERELRSLIGNIADMQTKHYAYLGTRDAFGPLEQKARKEMHSGNSKLTIQSVSGDHFSSLAPAMKQFLATINSTAP